MLVIAFTVVDKQYNKTELCGYFESVSHFYNSIEKGREIQTGRWRHVFIDWIKEQ